MSYITNDELEQELMKLDEQIKAINAERAAKGLPDEYPADFVGAAMAWHLYERCEPVYQFAIKYARICDKANDIIELSDEQVKWLLSFKRYARLVSFTENEFAIKTLGQSYRGIIDALTNPSKYESVIELLRGLQINLSFITGEYCRPYLHGYLWGAESEEYRSEVYQEYERLKDDEKAFNEELKRLNEHYESIKEELKTWKY